MGDHTYAVPLALFKTNRNRLVKALEADHKNSIVLLEGGDEVSFYDTDITYNVFRQVRNSCIHRRSLWMYYFMNSELYVNLTLSYFIKCDS